MKIFNFETRRDVIQFNKQSQRQGHKYLTKMLFPILESLKRSL